MDKLFKIQVVLSFVIVLLKADFNYSLYFNNYLTKFQSSHQDPVNDFLLSTETSRNVVPSKFQNWRERLRLRDISLFARRNYKDTNVIAQPKKPNFQKHLTASNILLGMNVAIFAVSNLIPDLHINRRFMKINYMISRGQTYRIVTPLFLHGSLPHLLMNSFSLKELGPQTEKTFGTTRFLILYFASGIIANIATYLIGVSPYSLGASGSIFGLMGGFAAFYIKNKQVLGRFSDAGLQSIMRNLMANLLYGMYANNIDTWAHLGGFAGGAVVSFIIAPKLKRLKYY